MDTVKQYHPSSLRMLEICSQFRNNENRDTTASDRGRRIHAAIETANFDGLDEEELECAAKCLEYKQTHFGALDGWEELAEFKMNTPTLLGTADLVLINEDRTQAILVDWKTGRQEVDSAESNLQMQCYAWMLMSLTGVQKVGVHIVAPLTETPSSEYCYTQDHVPGIHTRVMKIIGRVESGSEPTPDEKACRWCGHKAACSGLTKIALRQASLLPLPDPVILEQHEIVTPEDRAKMQIIAVILEDWAKQVKQRNTAAVVEDGVEIPGFVLRQRAGNTTVVNVNQAIKRLIENEVPLATILAAATLSLPKLTDTYSAEKGGNKKDNRKVLETLLQDTLAQGEPITYLQRAMVKAKG